MEDMTKPGRAWWPLALFASGLLGCDPGPSPDDADAVEARNARAVSHGSWSLGGAPGFAALGSLFKVDAGLDTSDHDTLRRDALTLVENRIALTFAALGCEIDLSTDGDRRLNLSMQGCRLLLWTIDTELEAVARVETVPCEAGDCADAITWELDAAELATGLLRLPKTRFFGPAELRAPLVEGEPMQWQTQPGFVLQTRQGQRFEMLSYASWTDDDEGCLQMDMGSRLELELEDDELDALVGQLVLSARGVHRCPGKCASAGEVELSFGAGYVVAWSHDGSDTVTAKTPRGREFEAQLPCAEENDRRDQGE